jgi:hypothetical protein
MSVNKLSISAIKKMPVVLGEVDVLKSILFPELQMLKELPVSMFVVVEQTRI